MITSPVSFSYPALTQRLKNHYLASAQQVLEAQQQIQTLEGRSIIHYALRDQETPQHIKHYPPGDRIDYQTGAQYFYHCHRENFESEEHGHFHCFIRYKHIPKEISPRPLLDWDKHIDSPMTHLIAIALNRFSEPIRLFAVNRWVSSEIWYDAQHTPAFIQQFRMTKQDDAYWQVLDAWLEGLIQLFAPQIAWVNQERDYVMQAKMLENPGVNVFEDESLEELASISINLKEQIEWVLK